MSTACLRASRRPPCALILELSKIENVWAPLLVLHGDRDEVVPFEGGRKLFASGNEPKRLYTIQGAGHNDTYLVGGREYFQALRQFVESSSQ